MQSINTVRDFFQFCLHACLDANDDSVLIKFQNGNMNSSLTKGELKRFIHDMKALLTKTFFVSSGIVNQLMIDFMEEKYDGNWDGKLEGMCYEEFQQWMMLKLDCLKTQNKNLPKIKVNKVRDEQEHY